MPVRILVAVSLCNAQYVFGGADVWLVLLYLQFVAATMHVSKLEREELLQTAFKELDRDGSGTITVEELAHALKKFNVFDDAASLLATADSNGDGVIDYREFVHMMREKALGERSEIKGKMSRF